MNVLVFNPHKKPPLRSFRCKRLVVAGLINNITTMPTPHKVTATFNVQAETESHAIMLIETYLNGKGVRTDGMVRFTLEAEKE